jgi:hypothetical protein
MSKLKIEHGVSRIRRAKLQTYIDQTVADDIELMSEWTNNEQHYIVNELLRFALMQSEEFQKFKTERGPKDSRTTGDTKPIPLVSTAVPNPALPLPKTSTASSAKSSVPATGITSHE